MPRKKTASPKPLAIEERDKEVNKDASEIKVFACNSEQEWSGLAKAIREMDGSQTTDVIHTFFEPCDRIDSATELSLLLEFIRRWEAIGYKVVVLNESIARKHPKFDQFMAKVLTFPSVNSNGENGYEARCWQRWLAFEYVGGGAHADYDLFPRAYLPIPVSGDLTVFEGASSANACPSLVSGTIGAVRKFIDHILSLPDGFAYSEKRKADDGQNNGHYSDMICIRDFPGLKITSWVKQYTEPGYQSAKFLHCSHGSMHPNGKAPRWKHIQAVMAEKEAA